MHSTEDQPHQRPRRPGPVPRSSGRTTQPYLVLTHEGPILVLAVKGSRWEDLRDGLRRRGHDKFIAWRLPAAAVQQAYGAPFDVLSGMLSPEQPTGVLDFDGVRVFRNLSLDLLGAQLPIEV